MNRFEYLQPKNIDEATRWLSDTSKKVMPIAGGSDLLGLIKHHIESPQALVNLKTIEGLADIKYHKGQGLRLGSQVKITDIAENKTIQEKYPVLAQAANQVASPQLRNMGTLGGNLCQRPRCWYFRGEFNCLRKGGDLCYAVGAENKYHCIVGGGPCYIVHPSDMAVALLALNAQLIIASGGETQTIALNDFYILPKDNVQREHILEAGQVITEIIVPDLPTATRSVYLKFKERAAWDFAIVSVAAVLQFEGKKVKSGKLSFGGVAPRPWVDEALQKNLAGLEIKDDSLNQFIAKAFKDAEFLEKNEYKIILVRNLIKTLLEQLSA